MIVNDHIFLPWVYLVPSMQQFLQCNVHTPSPHVNLYLRSAYHPGIVSMKRLKLTNRSLGRQACCILKESPTKVRKFSKLTTSVICILLSAPPARISEVEKI